MQLDDYASGAALATELVNSGPEVMGDEQLDTPEVGAALLADLGVETSRTLDAADIERLHQLRARIRSVIASAAEGDTAAAVADLDALLAEVATSPRLAALDGGWEWEVVPVDWRASTEVAVVAAAGLLALIRRLGGNRLGRCAKDGCAGMFADSSRPGSRRYCTPARCGNRINVAAFRARQRDEA